MFIDKILLQEACEKAGYIVEFGKRQKDNQMLTSVYFKFGIKEDENGVSMTPVFYLEHLEADFYGDYDALALKLADDTKRYIEMYSQRQTFDLSMLKDWNWVKTRIRPTLRTDNPEIESLVAMDFCGLHIIFYIDVDIVGENIHMVKVGKDMFKEWHISLEELYKASMMNCTDFCVELRDGSTSMEEAKELLVSNETKDEGVIAFAHPAIIPAFAEQLNTNFIVLAHTTMGIQLIKTDAEGLTLAQTFSLVTQLNNVLKEIPENLHLARAPYFYNRKTKQLTLCD